MRVGLIRCIQTEDMCSTTACLNAMRNKNAAFKDVGEEITLVNINTCGGCPGKKAVTRAVNMIKNGCDTIALASCITNGSPIGFPCPHKDVMLAAIKSKADKDIQILTYTH